MKERMEKVFSSWNFFRDIVGWVAFKKMKISRVFLLHLDLLVINRFIDYVDLANFE